VWHAKTFYVLNASYFVSVDNEEDVIITDDEDDEEEVKSFFFCVHLNTLSRKAGD